MDGLYVIILVAIICSYYLYKSKKIPKSDNTSKTNFFDIWERFGDNFKWGSIVLCMVTTFFLGMEILSNSKLKGAELAQADFGIFLSFMIYVLPSILLVLLAIFLHLKYIFSKSTISLSYFFQPFLVCALIIVVFSIVLFIKGLDIYG